MPTILHRLERWAEASPDCIAQAMRPARSPSSRLSKGWERITVREYRDRVAFLAAFLDSRGVGFESVGANLSSNLPGVFHFELALALLRAKSAGLYMNSVQHELETILNQAEATVLIVQNQSCLRKIVGEQDEHPLPARIKLIISLEGVVDGKFDRGVEKISYPEALGQGRALCGGSPSECFKRYLSKVTPEDSPFLIYTSGTTGVPKGALITHDNLVFNSDLIVRDWAVPPGGVMFSFLPFCHIAEKIYSIGIGITQGSEVYFCSSLGRISAELQEVQPTLLLCVPRLWERMMTGVMTRLRAGGMIRRNFAAWALQVGSGWFDAKRRRSLSLVWRWLPFAVANFLVLAKVRKALGLERIQVAAAGAAALSTSVSQWFKSLNIRILENFGQTETAGLICMSNLDSECPGAIGRPSEGIEVRIADDGEILTRGRNVFAGYWKDSLATSQALEGDWLHTGDIGLWTDQGALRVQGRKREVLKTSGGKMIAPLPIETRLKNSDLISQVCLVGDGRKYLAALFTLSEPYLGKVKIDQEDVVIDDSILKSIKKHVESINQSLAVYEQVRRFTVLGRDFSIEKGELTPTLKMKRDAIESKFKGLIDRMYH